MSLTAQQKDGLKAAVIFLAVVFGGLYYYQSYFVEDQVNALKKQEQTVKVEIKALQDRINEFDEMERNYAEIQRMQEVLGLISRKLPTSPDPQRFLTALEPILQVTNFEYTDLQPQATKPMSSFTEIPYRIIGKCRYHDFGQFLNMIEENPTLFMRVKTFDVKNQDNRPSIHPATIDVASFMFNSKG